MSDRIRVLTTPESRWALYLRRLKEAVQARGCDVVETPPPWIRWPGNALRFATALARRPDVLQMHWDTFDSRLVMRAVLGLGMPKVWTVHTITQNAPASMGGLDVTARYLGRVDVAVWHSARTIEETRRRLAAAGLPTSWRARDVVIPHMSFNGFFPDEATPEASRAALGLPPDAFVVGHFSPSVRKGTRRFLEIVTAMPAAEATFLVFGRCEDPVLSEEIVRCTRDHPNVRARIDWIPKEGLQTWFKACDVVVEPYLDCVTSSTVQCAMAFRRPSIAPPLGNLPDLVVPRETGWLATTLDEIVEAVREARASPSATREMGERAYARADALASLDKVGDAYARVYTELAAR